MRRGIPTTYGGVRFRSKLEARWAQFFDAVGTPWEYEPRRFPLGERSSYTPDFYLANVGFWLEVKPLLDDSELSAVIARLEDFVNEHRVRLALLCGFGDGSDVRFFPPDLREHFHILVIPHSVAPRRQFLTWLRCAGCRRVMLEGVDDSRLAEIEGYRRCQWCGGTNAPDSLRDTFGDVAAFGVAP